MNAAWLLSVWVWAPVFSAGISAVALVMTLINLRVYQRAPAAVGGPPTDAAPDARTDAPTPRAAAPASSSAAPMVAVCIPARNEEANLAAVVGSALASTGVTLEVLVYDDESTDATPAILQSLAAQDPRVVAVPHQRMPAGWNGKQWGCQQMGHAARAEWLLFTDADVRLAPDCLERSLAAAHQLRADLLSTVPRQVTGTFLERLVVPLIHWMLFSWLPMPRMRATRDPATSAGCGQFLLVRRAAWQAAGGHAAFPSSMHDGIKLPRAVRRAGFHTDLFDGTSLVQCRMYHSASQVWRGFTKNAYEGLGSPVVLLVFTLLEVAGTLLPWVWLPAAFLLPEVPEPALWCAALAACMQVVQRTMLATRFQQGALCVLLHPVSIALLVAIQWRSAWLHATGQRAWKGRQAGQSAPAPSAGTALPGP